MTAVAALVADFERAGIRLEARSGRLHFRADRSVTAAELERLTANKLALLDYLSGPKAVTGIAYQLCTAIRTRLLRLAASEGLPASIVDTIPNDELPLYDELADADLRLPLHLLARYSLCGGTERHHDHLEHDHAEA